MLLKVKVVVILAHGREQEGIFWVLIMFLIWVQLHGVIRFLKNSLSDLCAFFVDRAFIKKAVLYTNIDIYRDGQNSSHKKLRNKN